MNGELFPVATRQRLARRPRRVMMHVTDAGLREDGADIACFRCGKCGHEVDWIEYRNVSEAKRGVPCPKCNGEESLYLRQDMVA